MWEEEYASGSGSKKEYERLNGTYPLRGSPEESGRIRAIGLATLRGSLV
jgi:hypothetical protein